MRLGAKPPAAAETQNENDTEKTETADKTTSETPADPNASDPMRPFVQRFNNGPRVSSSIAEEQGTDNESQPRSSNARPIASQQSNFEPSLRGQPPPPLHERGQYQPPPGTHTGPVYGYRPPPPPQNGGPGPSNGGYGVVPPFLAQQAAAQQGPQHGPQQPTLPALPAQQQQQQQQQQQRETGAQDDDSLPPSPINEDQAEYTSPVLPRIPSFKGLPPIRRNSNIKLENPTSDWGFGDFGDFSFDNTVLDKKEDAPATAAAAESSNLVRQSEESTDNSDAGFAPADNATTKSMGLDSNAATLVGHESTRGSLIQKEHRFSDAPPVPNSNPTQWLQQQQQPQQGGSNPVQAQPPSGWQLEESHLSEPLQPSRRRPDPEGAAPQGPYLDKETGVASGSSHAAATAGQRHGNASGSSDSDSDDGPSDEPEQVNSDPAHGSTVLGVPGQPQPPPPQQVSQPPVAAQVSPEAESVAMATTSPRPASPTRSVPQDVVQQPQPDANRAFFAPAPPRFVPGGMPRPSTAGQAGEAGSIAESTGGNKRKLFGGLVNKFKPSGNDAPQKPASAYSDQTSITGVPPLATGPNALNPAAQGQGRDRSGTVGSVSSFGIAPPSGHPDGRERQGSISNMFTSFFKNKPDSQPRAQGSADSGFAEQSRESVDGGRRSSRHLSQGSVTNPARPSPLANEFNMNSNTSLPQSEQGSGLRTAAPAVPHEGTTNGESDPAKPLPVPPTGVNGQVLGGDVRASNSPAFGLTAERLTPPPSKQGLPFNRPTRPMVQPVGSNTQLSNHSVDSPSSQMPPPLTGWRPSRNTPPAASLEDLQQQANAQAQDAKSGKRGFGLGGKPSQPQPQPQPGGKKSKWKGWKEKLLVGRAGQNSQDQADTTEQDDWKHRMSMQQPPPDQQQLQQQQQYQPSPLQQQEMQPPKLGGSTGVLGAFKRGSGANGHEGPPQQGTPMPPGPQGPPGAPNQQGPRPFPGPQGFVPQSHPHPSLRPLANSGGDHWAFQQQGQGQSQHPYAQAGGQFGPPQNRAMSTGFYAGQPPPHGFRPAQYQPAPQQQHVLTPPPSMAQQQSPAQQPVQQQMQPADVAVQAPQQPQSLPPPDRPLSQAATTPGDSTDGFILPIQGPIQGSDANEGQPTPAPTIPRTNTVTSRISTESGAIGGGHESARGASPVPHQQQPQIHPQVSKVSMNTVENAVGDDAASRARESIHSATPALSNNNKAASILSNSTGIESKAMSRNTSVRQEPEPRQQSPPAIVHAVVATPPAHESIPRLKQDPTGSSHNISEVSKSNTGSSLTSTGGSTTAVTTAQPSQVAHIELEDTNDARMRTLRLDGQEEKIFYEPEPEMPKMTATSYPGQEWNPYGEPEFMMGDD